MSEWPEWWSWEIELSGHLLRRMMDRELSETDLRLMLEEAIGYHPNYEPGRYVIETRHEGIPWEVIVEPDPADRVVVVITAYRVERQG